MKNLFKSAALLLACGAFFACSNDDVVGESPVLENGTAYLAVNIHYANGDGTRALGGFENAVQDERKVNTADFYFYDAAGNYITHARPTATSNGSDKTPAESVQFEMTNILVLHGLESQMPSRMMCVINEPTGLGLQNKPFDYAAKKVADVAISDPGAFIMTSTAFDANTAGVKNVGVELKAGDFLSELVDANHANHSTDKVKDVYVERIAAKFNVGYADDLYPVSATLPNVFEIASFNVDGAERTLYAKIEGWGLNVTAKEFYLYKKVTTGANYFTGWSDATIRSYWGEVPFYANNAETAYAKNENDGNNYEGEDIAAQVVDYFPWSSLIKKIGQPTSATDVYADFYAYAAPNTNTEEGVGNVLAGHYTNRATNVLIAARVCDVDGVNVELVNYGGALLTKSAFITRTLEKYGLTEIWKKTSAEGVTPATYEKITQDHVTFANVGDGVGKFTIAGEWYDKDAGGNYTATAKTAEIAAAQNEQAEIYEGGMMYYTIPVAHNLLETAKAWNMDGYVAKNGNYGVVRNHSYQLTITEIMNIGHAVLDPDKDIVPNDDDAKRYYLLSTINVLAWRTVTQSVKL